MSFLGNYAEAVLNNKEQATLLIGPYGKGKSHLLLVLLAVLSLERNAQNDKIIKKILKKIQSTDEIGTQVSKELEELWKRNKYLPLPLSGSLPVRQNSVVPQTVKTHPFLALHLRPGVL